MKFHIYVYFIVEIHIFVEYKEKNSKELQKILKKQGCTFEMRRGGSGHITVRKGDKFTQMPMHGSHKELGKGLVNKILKDLGLK